MLRGTFNNSGRDGYVRAAGVSEGGDFTARSRKSGSVPSTGGFQQVEMEVERAASRAKVGNGGDRGAEAGK